MIRTVRPLLSALALVLTLPASADIARLPTASPVPGGVALVPVPTSQASLKGRPVMVVSAKGTRYAEHAPWLAVVGIDLSTEPGTLALNAGTQTISFEVKDKQYREQRLTIKNKRHVNPEKRDMERIGRERKEMLTALGNWRDDNAPVTRFELPARGPFSSPFGLKRFFNDQPRAPHSGLDIAAPKGAPITAPAPGVVTAAGDYFFNGRNVVLDHGHGLVTMYSHLDRIDVSVGDRVKTGDSLGTIGNSGRVTGPHLHWTVSLNNVRVDPMLFIDPPAK
ncbi:peptidoglycan DD-metalloendopeptidase family protein [Motiliproteus sediminis]|uniref:peptidoglycan DD-metalloendopeptidase family protein n=1 Tax=Motiliproteus sediminis TaxID=1468178 RepID=UPI0031BA9130